MDNSEMKDIFESENTEFKEANHELPVSIYKTITAFANTKGGMIVLGIKQDGKKFVVQGVDNPQKLIDDLVSTACQKYNFCPVIKPAIEKLNSKHIVKIQVEEALRYEKPIYIKDAGPLKGGFKRVGSSDIQLTDKDLHRFYQERQHSPDALVLKDSSIKDIDTKTVSIFKEIRKGQKPGSMESRAKVADVLKAYNLVSKDGKHITAAGILLFGTTTAVRKYFPHFRLDIIRIKGTEWGKDKNPFLSNDLIGNLIQLRNQALDITGRLYLTPFKLGKNLARIDDDPFKRALREALGNLLMHQNYFHTSPSQIRIYNDRIEFYNPGYSLKDPRDYMIPGSELRNTLIAPVFYDMGWAESKGTGFKTSILSLPDNHYPSAHWNNNERNDTFTIVFPHPKEEVDTTQVSAQVSAQVNPLLLESPGSAGGGMIDEVAGGRVIEGASGSCRRSSTHPYGFELRDKIAALLVFCKGPRTQKEMLDFFGAKHRGYFAKVVLKDLLKNNFLKRTIPNKPNSRFQKYISADKTK